MRRCSCIFLNTLLVVGDVSQCTNCHGAEFDRVVGGKACIDCHPDAKQGKFAPVDNCQQCHGESQVARRQIVGVGGDFMKTSHHGPRSPRSTEQTSSRDLLTPSRYSIQHRVLTTQSPSGITTQMAQP